MSSNPIRKFVCSCVLTFATLLLAVSAFAQYRAGIQGSVLDPQGETISAATVILTNKETGRTVSVTVRRPSARST
jgi:hypothetical protein